MSQDFIQNSPNFNSALNKNYILKAILNTLIPSQFYTEIFHDLETFENKIIEYIEQIGHQAELHPPTLTKYSPWGQEINQINVSSFWKELHEFSASEGLITEGYIRRFKEFSRLFQLSKLYLFHPSSAFYSCPLAMADGAAKVLEHFKNQNSLFKNAFDHLISKDPKEFWTSGQWMTEKTGGSDISQTSTYAQKHEDHYLLSGIKWFSSATTSEMALGLARVISDQTSESHKSSKLSLFYIPMRNQDGSLNGIEVLRLKEKLGTKALPTAELKLKDTKAYLIGELGQGVKTVAMMLNITRIYNSICSVAQMERALSYLEDYSTKRIVFGQKLIDQPLHIQNVAELKALHFSSSAITFYVSKLLGEEETSIISESNKVMLRLLTPIAKMYTAKLAVKITSEVIEGIGGAGYVEDTKIPVLFRDAQVFPIWEGATNVLSLDFLRVLKKSNTIEILLKDCEIKLNYIKSKNQDLAFNLETNYKILKNFIVKNGNQTEDAFWQSVAKEFSWGLAEVYSGLLMAEIAIHNSEDVRLEALLRIFNQKIKINLLENPIHNLNLCRQVLS